jgi:hypothetical protein
VLILILHYVQVQSYLVEDSCIDPRQRRGHNTGHPLIVLNTIGCIFTLVYGYWKYHKMGVLIFILHYFLVQHWNVECVWCNHPFILHLWVVFYILVYWLILDVLILVVFYTLVYWLIKVSWNGCFDINPVLCPRTVVLSRGQLYWPSWV